MDITEEDVKKYLEKQGHKNVEFKEVNGKSVVSFIRDVFGHEKKDESYTVAYVQRMIKETYDIKKIERIEAVNTSRDVVDTIIKALSEDMDVEYFSAITLGFGRILSNYEKVILVLNK